MKRYIRANTDVKITADNWPEFLQKIEEQLPYEIDSAYRRKRKGDPYIVLIDNDGNTYTGEYTEYTDGSFELLGYNIHKNNYQQNSER